jgi:transposase InsO family protein
VLPPTNLTIFQSLRQFQSTVVTMSDHLTRGQIEMLEKAYFNPAHAGSFSSAKGLRTSLQMKKQSQKRGNRVRLPTQKQIQNWLLTKRAYTAHRPARKKYPMKQVIVSGVNTQIQADLVEMQPWANTNDGYRYILLAIDCFSRYAYARPLKTKQGEPVASAFESIFTEAEKRIDRKIKKLQVDQGREFYNKHVEELVKRRNIVMFSVKSQVKAQLAERLIRTLRTRQEKYNTFTGKRRWVESFSQLVKSYNATSHSALPKNMSPASVNLSNERRVWEHLYKDSFQYKRPRTALLKLGAAVRISKRKRTFEKAYYQNWTDEIFFISQVIARSKPPSYRLVDSAGEKIEGNFYKHELTPVGDKAAVYAVENVLRRENRNGEKFLFVKWKGYPDSENSWVRADQFTSIKKAI